MSEMKISDIIISNPYLILMLEHLGINMEVREKTVEQICNENKISSGLFLIIANLFNGYKPSPIDEYSFNDIQTIVNYLKKSHHYYLEEKYPIIQDYIEMINRINDHPEILMIGKFFDKYFKEVIEHLDYEDDVVFPYVLRLNDRLSLKGTDDTPINYSVTEYREHHNDIEEKLADLNNLLIRPEPAEPFQPGLQVSWFRSEWIWQIGFPVGGSKPLAERSKVTSTQWNNGRNGVLNTKFNERI